MWENSKGVDNKIWIGPYGQISFCISISPGEWEAQKPLGFRDSIGKPNLIQTTRPYNKKKRNSRIVDLEKNRIVDLEKKKQKEG